MVKKGLGDSPYYDVVQPHQNGSASLQQVFRFAVHAFNPLSPHFLEISNAWRKRHFKWAAPKQVNERNTIYGLNDMCGYLNDSLDRAAHLASPDLRFHAVYGVKPDTLHIIYTSDEVMDQFITYGGDLGRVYKDGGFGLRFSGRLKILELKKDPAVRYSNFTVEDYRSDNLPQTIAVPNLSALEKVVFERFPIRRMTGGSISSLEEFRKGFEDYRDLFERYAAAFTDVRPRNFSS